MEASHNILISDIIKDYSNGKTGIITHSILDNNPLERKNYAVFLEAKYKSDSNYQDLSGFEVIYKLRQKYKFKGSIVVFSFLEEDQIININYKDKQLFPARILHTSNIEFYTINGAFKNKKDIRNAVHSFLNHKYKLEDLGLEDIMNYVSNYGYLLDEVLHDFKNENSYQTKPLEDNIEKLKKDVLPFIKPESINEVNTSLDNHKNIDRSNFDSSYNMIKGLLQGELKTNEFSTEGVNQTNVVKEREWEVLYIDDDEEACHQISELFSKKPFYLKCHTANNMAEINKFANDINNNKIYWVISDYRLKNRSKWFPLQGYDLLVNLFEAPKLLRSISTTSNNLINNSARFNNNENILWYNKALMLENSDYFEWAVNSQVNTIDTKYANRDIFDYPSSWYKPIKTYVSPFNMGISFIKLYKELQKIKTDWTSFNKNIDDVALDFFVKIQKTDSKQKNQINKELISKRDELISTLRNNKLISEFESLEIQPLAKLKETNFEHYMYNRLLIRRLLIGHYYLFNDGFVDQLKNNNNKLIGKNNKSIINQLSGFYPGEIKKKNKLNNNELHKDDKTFLAKLDNFKI